MGKQEQREAMGEDTVVLPAFPTENNKAVAIATSEYHALLIRSKAGVLCTTVFHPPALHGRPSKLPFITES